MELLGEVTGKGVAIRFYELIDTFGFDHTILNYTPLTQEVK
jgi:hypothetical protein